MAQTLRQLLLVLIAFAIVGGTSHQLARSAQYMTPVAMVGMSCDMTMKHTSVPHEVPTAPCKRMTADCINQMGCVIDAAVPSRPVCTEILVQSRRVDYWSVGSKLADFVRSPEPLPPRMA